MNPRSDAAQATVNGGSGFRRQPADRPAAIANSQRRRPEAPGTEGCAEREQQRENRVMQARDALIAGGGTPCDREVRRDRGAHAVIFCPEAALR
jgi:hypothetical protein